MLLFSFVTGNADMHLKNFSLYAPDGRWILSPAYDLVATSVVLPDDPDETALTLNGKRRKLERTDFLAFAKSVGIHEKAAAGLTAKVAEACEHMPEIIERSEVMPPAAERYVEIVRARAERL
jgi:serine/threonine-protein kinase HipA